MVLAQQRDSVQTIEPPLPSQGAIARNPPRTPTGRVNLESREET